MKDNIIKDKSFSFALRIVKLYQYLVEEKKEFNSIYSEVREIKKYWFL